MTYFRVDDHFHSHQKVLTLGLEAIGLWTLAGSWSGEQLTDGFIPAALVMRLGSSLTVANDLVSSGLWEEVEGGFLFHGWSSHNQTRAQVIESREAWRIKKNKQRAYRHLPPVGESSEESLDMSLGDTSGESLAESHESPGIRNKEQGIRKKELGIGTKERGTKEKDELFEKFWKVYPRRAGKQNALTAWRKALGISDAETIINAAESYANDPNREERFTAHPATWLNQGRWEDDPLPNTTPMTAREVMFKKIDAFGEELKKQEAEASWGVLGQ